MPVGIWQWKNYRVAITDRWKASIAIGTHILAASDRGFCSANRLRALALGVGPKSPTAGGFIWPS